MDVSGDRLKSPAPNPVGKRSKVTKATHQQTQQQTSRLAQNDVTKCAKTMMTAKRWKMGLVSCCCCLILLSFRPTTDRVGWFNFPAFPPFHFRFSNRAIELICSGPIKAVSLFASERGAGKEGKAENRIMTGPPGWMHRLRPQKSRLFLKENPTTCLD